MSGWGETVPPQEEERYRYFDLLYEREAICMSHQIPEKDELADVPGQDSKQYRLVYCISKQNQQNKPKNPQGRYSNQNTKEIISTVFCYLSITLKTNILKMVRKSNIEEPFL